MKIKFHVLTGFTRPGLHIWDEKDSHFPLRCLHPVTGPENGWWLFESELDQNLSIGFKLLEWNEQKSKAKIWESDDGTYNRVIMINPGEKLQDEVWLVQGSTRVMPEDPKANTVHQLKIHLITKKAYRYGRLYAWIPGQTAFTVEPEGEDNHGPYFTIDLRGDFRHAFNFKFIEADGSFEPDFANRTWSSADGAEIWTHSKAATVIRQIPKQHRLTVHLRHEWGDVPVKMHLWQEASDFQEDLDGQKETDGWITYQTGQKLYSNLPYGVMFFKPGWDMKEDEESRRFVRLTDDAEYWTLEGSNILFNTRPERNKQVIIEIVGKAPECNFTTPDYIQVKIDRAVRPLPPQYEKLPDGNWTFWTYPEVISSFRFSNSQLQEPVEHRIFPVYDQFKTFIVLGRGPCLFERPPQQLFADPPYRIERPGVVEADGFLRFAIHARWCSRIRLKNEWQPTGTIDLQSTTDGKYWWTQLPIREVIDGLGREDYHGAWYQYLLNDTAGGQVNTDINGAKTVQDPAAGWVASTAPAGRSKLVNHRKYTWQSAAWQTPGWEYLSVYELHPARFTNRNGLTPFGEIAREIESGYLKDLGFTAILLMPSNEFPGTGWGYNPSYYYAVKDAYGGPDELKKLVDVCHRHHIAVLLDVVFNHAGIGDNILWELDKNTYFEGDTNWGAMINFSDGICREFFAKCLTYWSQEYHIDGFRFDMTNPIIEGHNWAPFVKMPNSDNQGWDFLHHLRRELKQQDGQCLMMAEQLPNNWGLTNYGGPMDTQWQDDFHDRLVDVCRCNFEQLGRFADALKASHTVCQQWYNVTPYPSSHDEVGNVNDRIAQLPGYGRGLRINKVAAAASLMARGIPMFFSGEESGVTEQFYHHSEKPLDLNELETDTNRQRVRSWWKTLLNLRRHNPRIQGPAPLEVHYVSGPVIAFSRGDVQDYFIVLNFSDGEIRENLGIMNLPAGTYQERLNSTYPAFQVEFENEYRNWGYLNRDTWLNIPDNGAVILERVN